MITRTKQIPNTSGIYQIVSDINGKRYIGSAAHLRWRKRTHFRFLRYGRHNRHFQNHYNKHGRDVLTFSIIEFCSREQLVKREQYWIDKLHPEFNVCKIAGPTRNPHPYCLERVRQENSIRMIKQWKDPIYRELVISHTKEWWISPEGQEYIERDSKRKKQRCNRPYIKKIWRKIINDPIVQKKRVSAILKTHAKPEYKEHQRQATTKLWLDIEYRKKQKKSRTGRIQSEESILHWKETYWERPIRTCPHCGFKSRNGNLKKYHLKNCKLNPNRPIKRTKFPLIVCPYCEFEGKSISAMKHWHFENCRHKI